MTLRSSALRGTLNGRNNRTRRAAVRDPPVEARPAAPSARCARRHGRKVGRRADRGGGANRHGRARAGPSRPHSRCRARSRSDGRRAQCRRGGDPAYRRASPQGQSLGGSAAGGEPGIRPGRQLAALYGALATGCCYSYRVIDGMTLAEAGEIFAYWEENPPPHLLLQTIARLLGWTPKPAPPGPPQIAAAAPP